MRRGKISTIMTTLHKYKKFVKKKNFKEKWKCVAYLRIESNDDITLLYYKKFVEKNNHF